MQTIITKACKELDIQPVPSQRVRTLVSQFGFVAMKTRVIKQDAHFVGLNCAMLPRSLV